MSKIIIDNYLQRATNAFAENRLLKLVSVVMLLVTLLNTWMMISMTNQQRTILMPLGTNMVFEVSAQRANDSYLSHMARYIIDLFGNIDHAKIKNNFNELLTLVHPKDYGRLKKHWKRYIADFSHYPSIAYSTAIDESIPIQIKGNNMIVHAKKQRIVGDKIAKKQRTSYQIDYFIQDGRFWLKDIKEIKSND